MSAFIYALYALCSVIAAQRIPRLENFLDAKPNEIGTCVYEELRRDICMCYLDSLWNAELESALIEGIELFID